MNNIKLFDIYIYIYIYIYDIIIFKYIIILDCNNISKQYILIDQ